MSCYLTTGNVNIEGEHSHAIFKLSGSIMVSASGVTMSLSEIILHCTAVYHNVLRWLNCMSPEEILGFLVARV